MNAHVKESTEVAVIPPKPLTVIERAAAVFTSVPSEEDLRELAKKSASITEITNEAGKDQCHASRMVLKNTRLEIERVGEEGREDAVQTSKAIIARQKALIGLTRPEEDRLAAIQKAWDDRIAAEKEAKVLAEIARVAGINKLLDGIRGWPIQATGKPSARVAELLAHAESYDLAESVFNERLDDAKAVLDVSRAALRGLHVAALDAEAKAEQLKRDQEELAKLRAAEEERQRVAAAERAKQEAADKAKRDDEAARQAVANRLERERIAKEEADAKAIRDAEAARNAEANRLEREAIEREAAENRRIATERQAALDRMEAAARQTREAEAQRQAAAAAELAAREEKLRVSQLPKPAAKRAKHNPGSEALIDVVASHYSVDANVARRWLAEIDWESVPA